jgi:hypothetical protein
MFNPGAAQSGFYGIIESGDSLKAVIKKGYKEYTMFREVSL